MLTRGPKDSPDPCKAQGQPCTLRGTKGRVTGAQAQPWAWLCCESRSCRGGGGGVGAALAAESPGSPRRDLPDPTTHKRGDEGLGQKVPTAERCVPALRASPVGWHLSAPLGRGDAPPPCDIDAEARASAARGRAEVAASSRTGLRSREPGGPARSLGRAEVQEGPRGVGEPDSGAGAGARMAVQPRVRPLPPQALRAARVPVHPFPASPPYSPVSPWPPVSWQPTRWWPLWG